MNDIFADMIDIMVIIYLDDILIYSDDISKHKAHVQEVLQKICASGLFSQANKCKFHVTSCKYLRYILSPEGLTMAPFKVQIIQDWPRHTYSKLLTQTAIVLNVNNHFKVVFF